LDATVGCGGHAMAIASLLGSEGIIVGLDRDDAAIERARTVLARSPARVVLRRADFAGLEHELDECGVATVDAVLFDLGMSSIQVDDPERGFSFRYEGPLDMRMDRRQKRTAADLVNDAAEDELADIFYTLGEERRSRRIAREIVRARSRERIRTTTELATLVERAKRERRGRIHPATRVFQALRVAVNDELHCLEEALGAAMRRLAPGGRLAAISFHSLEDRIVKQNFRAFAREGAAEILTPKPVRPGREECRANPRSRSAKLRVVRAAGRTRKEAAS